MYIKQLLYLLEKFVTVLGGKERRAHPDPGPLSFLWSIPWVPVRTPGFSASSRIVLAIDVEDSYFL